MKKATEEDSAKRRRKETRQIQKGKQGIEL